MVYILLGAGFEEMEAIVPCDLLRRAGIPVQFVGIGGTLVTGGHGIPVQADRTIDELDITTAEMLVLPGGMGGVRSILACEVALDAVRRAHAQGNFVAAICAAPTILAKLGLLSGKRATCYPDMEPELTGATAIPYAGAVTDGRLITGTAAGTAFEFAAALIAALRDEQTAQRVLAEVVYHRTSQA